MTPEQKAIVQATWREVVPIADTAAELFYDRLFETDPALYNLFLSTDMSEQRHRLMQMMGLAISGLNDLDKLVPVVADLGRRHAGYGVEDRHYDTVGEALLWTLERGLGDLWTLEAAEAWTAVYGLLSGTMRSAASQSAAAPAAASIA